MLPAFICGNVSRRTAAVDETRPSSRNKTSPSPRSLPSALFHSVTNRIPKLQRATKSSTQHRFKNRMATSGMEGESNALLWMQEHCPSDLLPKILTFCGPQTMAALSKTNKFLNELMQQESTWMVLCSELGKWNEGDILPTSWRSHYQTNIIVPMDYSSIEAALAVSAPNQECHNNKLVEQSRSIRILLKPAKYYLREAITIRALEATEITIETLSMTSRPPVSYILCPEENIPEKSPAKRVLKKVASFRDLLSCRSGAGINTVNSEETVGEGPEPPAPVRASLQLRTRCHNEPLFRVRQGTIKLVNIQLVHNSHGIDIWNGNAAIQIQPAMDPDNESPLAMVLPRPAAYMESVDITSKSGRGIVNIDGGFVSIKKCYVHDCAATGIYVGGPGSDAVIESSDVVRNGNGNRMRRGIARGHSGIYIEQGNALVRDCNISRNSLTGISAISIENAILNLRESALVGNGTTQLEMPPNGTTARRLSSTVNNLILHSGIITTRSGLANDEHESVTTTLE